jgi:hypothetical protein
MVRGSVPVPPGSAAGAVSVSPRAVRQGNHELATSIESEGWPRTVETLVLFWVAGLIAYVLDPIVNGTRTGTSSFALLASAIFWTWLWGPVGLLLSTPITVCLLAVGKHVPERNFSACCWPTSGRIRSSHSAADHTKRDVHGLNDPSHGDL